MIIFYFISQFKKYGLDISMEKFETALKQVDNPDFQTNERSSYIKWGPN